jgi:hypothetical protein
MRFTTETQRTQRTHRDLLTFKPLCYLCVLCVSVVNNSCHTFIWTRNRERCPRLLHVSTGVDKVEGFYLPYVELMLLNLDAIAHHPEVELFETFFPTNFELFHPLMGFSRIRHINHYSD